MLPLNKILTSRMREAGLARNIVIAQILAETKKWIVSIWGEEIAGKITVRSLIKGEIVVYIGHPALLDNLRLREGELIRHINSKFGGKVVSRLQFNTN